MDTETGVWRSDGVEVIEQGTNTTHTHCQSTHLTEFAGGFIVLPPTIDFDYAFANASFEKNALIYMTVIGVTCLYILLAIWAVYADRLDKLKTGICVLSDTGSGPLGLSIESTYLYEFMVLTGARNGAATDSKVTVLSFRGSTPDDLAELMFDFLFRFPWTKVSFILSGEKGKSDVRSFSSSSSDSNRKILRRGGMDSFIIGVQRWEKSSSATWSSFRFQRSFTVWDGLWCFLRPLGPLTYLRVWHDNSGSGDMASWFLKCVIVHDLQTREMSYFICHSG